MTQKSRYASRPGSRRRNQKRALIAVACVLALALAGGIWAGIAAHNRRVAAERAEAERLRLIEEERSRVQAEVDAAQSVFAENIYLDGEKISGRGYDEVLSDFTARYDERLKRDVTIRFSGGEWHFSAAQVGGTVDVKEQVDAAWRIGHTGDTDEKYAQLQDQKTTSAYFSVSLRYDREALEAFAKQLKEAVDKEPVDATMEVVKAGEVEYTDSEIGYDLDLEETEALLVRSVEEGGTDDIELLPQVIEPEVTEDTLSGTYVQLAKYATYYNGSTYERSANIKLCLDKFNGLIVEPGEKVSFNDVVGPRTTGRGFKEAVEYVNGNKELGVGGGTCQASTTVYGAVLRAGLTINQRQSHSLPVKYVPPSQDATVSNSGADLVFTNNTPGKLYIYTSINKEKMRAMVTIYGTPIKQNIRIEIESEIIQNDIAANPKYIKDTEGIHVWYKDEAPVLKTQGSTGYRSKAYRVYYSTVSGAEVRREELSVDYYSPIPAEYYVGVH